MTKKILFIILGLIVITGCNNEKKVVENVDEYEILDKTFTNNNISFIREAKLKEDDYYALEGWQYAINDANCIVDVYRYNIESNTYKEFLNRSAIKSKTYDNEYVTAIVNKGFAAIIWDGCINKEQIEDIIINLE